MADSEAQKEEIIIDAVKVQRILQKVILREKTNLKTKERNDMQMVNAIKKLIEEEVECY
jgi:hypothetical protein